MCIRDRAWVIWVAAAPAASDLAIGIFLALAFLYGCWACDRVGRELQQPDHVGMVWDEMVAFWLVLWLTPAGWLSQTLAFVPVSYTHLDVYKRQISNPSGGSMASSAST